MAYLHPSGEHASDGTKRVYHAFEREIAVRVETAREPVPVVVELGAYRPQLLAPRVIALQVPLLGREPVEPIPLTRRIELYASDGSPFDEIGLGRDDAVGGVGMGAVDR